MEARKLLTMSFGPISVCAADEECTFVDIESRSDEPPKVVEMDVDVEKRTGFTSVWIDDERNAVKIAFLDAAAQCGIEISESEADTMTDQLIGPKHLDVGEINMLSLTSREQAMRLVARQVSTDLLEGVTIRPEERNLQLETYALGARDRLLDESHHIKRMCKPYRKPKALKGR